MAATTTTRVSMTTRHELKEMAAAHGHTVSETVDRGLRLLQQERISRDLAAPLTGDEVDWLNADAG